MTILQIFEGHNHTVLRGSRTYIGRFHFPAPIRRDRDRKPNNKARSSATSNIDFSRRRRASPPSLWGRDRVGGRAMPNQLALSLAGAKDKMGSAPKGSSSISVRRDPPPRPAPTRGGGSARARFIHRGRPNAGAELAGENPMIARGRVSTRTLAGKCYCGAVEYAVADEFLNAANCHCSNCRRALRLAPLFRRAWRQLCACRDGNAHRRPDHTADAPHFRRLQSAVVYHRRRPAAVRRDRPARRTRGRLVARVNKIEGRRYSLTPCGGGLGRGVAPSHL